MKLFLFFFLFLLTPLFGHEFQVLGLGAPNLDYIFDVEESYLDQFQLKKGGWHEVDAQTLAETISQSGNSPLIFSGSCVANTIKGLASLGISCALTGNVGNDISGDRIRKIFHNLGVTTFFTETTTPTSQVACMVTPDGERSFCSFVEAEHEISEDDLNPELFENVKLVHLSGYRLPNGTYPEKGLALAKKTGATVSFDLANAFLTQKYRERLWGMLSAYVDIVFANEEEAYALTGLAPKQAAVFLKNFCHIAVVKVGEKGCWVCSKEKVFHTPAIHTARVVDKTGAGDLFASAFLYCYLKGASLEKCAYFGNLAGSSAVERYGAELSNKRWAEILSCIQSDPSL